MISRRLSFRDTAAVLGINLGDMIKLRSNGARNFDPSFPQQTNATFDETEILAWKAARDNRQTANTPPSPPTAPQQDRRIGIDRRKSHGRA
jgi:hypothetical protein